MSRLSMYSAFAFLFFTTLPDAAAETASMTDSPHSAFRGQTPDEMYFGTGNHIPDQLEAAKSNARHDRMEVNRAMSCPTCERW